MTEDQLMALIGRLYVGAMVRDAELKRLNGLVDEYRRLASQPDDESDDETQETR